MKDGKNSEWKAGGDRKVSNLIISRFDRREGGERWGMDTLTANRKQRRGGGGG